MAATVKEDMEAEGEDAGVSAEATVADMAVAGAGVEEEVSEGVIRFS